MKSERTQKEKKETNEVKSNQETEVKLKTTVVDIDSVRDEVKEENLGLLEAAEQEDGESEAEHCISRGLWLYFCNIFQFFSPRCFQKSCHLKCF